VLPLSLSTYNLLFLALGFPHGVRGEFADDVLETAVVSETSFVNSARTPCRNPRDKKRMCSSHGENLKSKHKTRLDLR
jgi:hypothetical protein